MKERPDRQQRGVLPGGGDGSDVQLQRLDGRAGRPFGRHADRSTRPLLLYAKLELGIAALGAVVYLLLLALPPVYAKVGGFLPGPVLALLRILIAGILILPPTFLMGGTLPVLSRFVVTRHDRLGRGLGLLYAVNTLGAVLGVFLAGFVINLHSDHVIRTLRKPGDTAFHIPRGGMFRYVTSANYFGELTEWVGWAILTFSWAGLVFAIWTFANLGPRANTHHQWYIENFGDAYPRNRKRMIPFVY